MKTNSTESGQSQLRRLVLRVLEEYPDGRLPASAQPEDFFPEIFHRPGVKSSDKKRAEEALRLIQAAETHRTSLDGEIASASVDAGTAGDKLAWALSRAALYELLEGKAGPESIFRDYMCLCNEHGRAAGDLNSADGGAQGKGARMEGMERLLFPALFATLQYFVWQALEESGGGNKPAPSSFRKLAQRLGYDEDLPAPEFGQRLVEHILACRTLLDAALEKIFKPRRWEALPSTCRNILRMGLYEILIDLASSQAITGSLLALLKLLPGQDEGSGGEAENQTRQFIKLGMVNCARSLGRALAFQIIYGLAFTGIASLAQLKEAYVLSPYNISAELDIEEPKEGVYSWTLVRGVWEHLKDLDAIIDKYSHKWRVERMGKIEITLLRLGLYEMIYEKVAPRIVISEIMDIADMFGAEEAKNLVNGILDAVSKSGEFSLKTRSS